MTPSGPSVGGERLSQASQCRTSLQVISLVVTAEAAYAIPKHMAALVQPT